MAGDHKWQMGTCSECGVSEVDWLNGTTWDELFCKGPIKPLSCCERPSKVFLGTQWVCENCDKSDTFEKAPIEYATSSKVYNPEPVPRKCTCGAKFRSTPDKHYIWCELEAD